MAKKNQNTISELLKIRPRGRFTDSFDLLKESDKILADKKNSDEAKKVGELTLVKTIENDNTTNPSRGNINIESTQRKDISSIPNSSKATSFSKRENSGSTESLQIYHQKAQEELLRLKDSNSSFTIDTQVSDVIFSKLKNPVASIVYIYLWRRTIGQGTDSIKISAKVLGDGVGISRKTAQLAIRLLNSVGLIHTDRIGELTVAEHKILRPWKKGF